MTDDPSAGLGFGAIDGVFLQEKVEMLRSSPAATRTTSTTSPSFQGHPRGVVPKSGSTTSPISARHAVLKARRRASSSASAARTSGLSPWTSRTARARRSSPCTGPSTATATPCFMCNPGRCRWWTATERTRARLGGVPRVPVVRSLVARDEAMNELRARGRLRDGAGQVPGALSCCNESYDLDVLERRRRARGATAATCGRADVRGHHGQEQHPHQVPAGHVAAEGGAAGDDGAGGV